MQPQIVWDLMSTVQPLSQSPHTTITVPLDIVVTPPIGTCCQILSRSGLYSKHGLEVKAGTIDRDYTGNVMVVLHNNGAQPYTVEKGQQVAQLVMHHIEQPTPMLVTNLAPTTRQDNGFGSTDVMPPTKVCAVKQAANPLQVILCTNRIKPYHIWLSQGPFHKCMDVSIHI